MKSILALIICFLPISFSVHAQQNTGEQKEKSPIVEFLLKRGYTFPDSNRIETPPDSLRKWPDTTYYNTSYKPKLMGSPTIPISFSRLERINGEYKLSPTISLGYGYEWFFGSFILNENDKITVDPTVFFGLIADVALQSDFSFNKLAGFFTGGFIGFGNFSLFAGYDYVTGSALLGLGGRIDLYTIHQNSLKPIGKVREARKHKKSALPIINE